MDLEKIRILAISHRDMSEYIDRELEKCDPDNPPRLTDLIVSEQRGGLQVLEALEAYYKDLHTPDELKFKWKILVMRDEWGNVPQPGEKFAFGIMTGLIITLPSVPAKKGPPAKKATEKKTKGNNGRKERASAP